MILLLLKKIYVKLKIVGKKSNLKIYLYYYIVMYSPFYNFLIKDHLRRTSPTTIRNTILGLIIKTKRTVKIPYSEQYETRDFTPKNTKSLKTP